MEHRLMLAVEHRKGAENKVRYPVFPAVAGAPGIRLRRRRFVQALQEPFDDPPSHADSIVPFLNRLWAHFCMLQHAKTGLSAPILQKYSAILAGFPLQSLAQKKYLV
jgi:hypothetical protein